MEAERISDIIYLAKARSKARQEIKRERGEGIGTEEFKYRSKSQLNDLK